MKLKTIFQPVPPSACFYLTGGWHPAGPQGGTGLPAPKALDERPDSRNELNNTITPRAKYSLFFIRDFPSYGF
jgi:hypothetical protein